MTKRKNKESNSASKNSAPSNFKEIFAEKMGSLDSTTAVKANPKAIANSGSTEYHRVPDNIIDTEQTPSHYSHKTKVIAVVLADIRVPSWYGKKYISQAELDRCVSFLKQGGVGVPNILLRSMEDNSTGDRYYELLDGLIVYYGCKKLGIKRFDCSVIQDSNFDVTEAMLASMSLNTRETLNHYESTVLAIAYLVKKLNLKTTERWIKIDSIGTRERKAIRDIDHAIGICKGVIKLRNARNNLTNEQKTSNDEYNELVKKITPEVEQAVDNVLKSIRVDLTTFIQRRVKLLDLPKDIITALNNGKLHYSKAISLSRVGHTREIQALTDRLNDVNVADDIIKERASILEETVEKQLTNSEVLERVHQANTRIFVHGTSQTQAGLSDNEIGERRQCREDLTLQARAKSDLQIINKSIKKFDFIDNLTEDEKITLQKRIVSLRKMVADLQQKTLNRMG